jgi:protein-tyrosine phosphatase
MIDIHSHIIFGVDDGAPNVEESVKMVLEAENQGIEAIVATPHYHDGLFEMENIQPHFNELCSRTKNSTVKLYTGSEISICPALPELLKQKGCLTLNKSKYLLLEFPYSYIPPYTNEILYKLNLENYVPIVAHPERNRVFLDNYSSFIEVLGKGCLIQLDAASILGVYGNSVKKFTRKMIKQRLAHFVASDAHCAKDYTRWYKEAYKQTMEWSDNGYAELLFDGNARRMLGQTVERR